MYMVAIFMCICFLPCCGFPSVRFPSFILLEGLRKSSPLKGNEYPKGKYILNNMFNSRGNIGKTCKQHGHIMDKSCK